MNEHPKFFVTLMTLPMQILIENDEDNYKVIRDIEGKDDWVRFVCFNKMYEVHVFKKRNSWMVNIHPVINMEVTDTSKMTRCSLRVIEEK